MIKKDYFQKFIRFGKTRGDITLLLANKQAFKKAIEAMIKPFLGKEIHKVIGIEARGFILGGAIANRMKVGFVPIRKSGKLPLKTISITTRDYKGRTTLEIHQDAIKNGERVLLVDDWFEVGGQGRAAVKLIEKLGGEIVGISVLVDDTSPDTKKHFQKYKYHFLIELNS